MALPTVHIRKEAFISLIFSVVDIFKRESFGFVLGYRPDKRRNYFLVTEFFPFSYLPIRRSLISARALFPDGSPETG